MGFLSDPKYLRHKGFETADTADPSFELMYLSFEKNASKPQFKPHVKEKNRNVPQNGFSLYHTNQCPFTAKYVPLLEKVAESKNIDFQSIHIDTREKAQNAHSPFTTFSPFYNEKFITHEILSEKKFETIIDSIKK